MLKPVCVECQRFYRPHKNGALVLEQMPRGSSRVPPGREHGHLWKPYKVWIADVWKCEGCGKEIVVGSGPGPVSEHYMPDFEAWRGRALITVNDC